MHDYRVLHNLYRGQTCLLVANGPSLTNVPQNFLGYGYAVKPFVTFGQNRIHRLWPFFAPDYYTCIGLNQVNAEEKRAKFKPYFDDDRVKGMFLNRNYIHEYTHPKVFSIRPPGGTSSNRVLFRRDPLNFIGVGYTTTFCLLQLAYYMGFFTALIVGLDHDYDKGEYKHFYSDEEEPLFEIGAGPYTNEVWQDGADMVYRAAREAWDGDGRRILNLTEGTKTNVFDKDAITNWI